MNNTIPTRVYDFLKDYPPFNLLEKEDLLKISERVIVQYWRPGDLLFQQGQAPQPIIYIVREGAIHLVREEADEETLYDTCDEGDVFGIRPLLAEEPYALTARAEEESLVYAIQIDLAREILEQNPKVSFYLARNFASGARGFNQPENKGRIFLNRDKLIDNHFQLTEVQSMERSKDPVTCKLDTTIQEAARVMSKEAVGSIIIVNEQFLPEGIITDKDLRQKVATGKVSYLENVQSIMSSPVITTSPEVTVADVQIQMVKNRINHLCLTEDGTRFSKVVGVLSEHDLMVMQGNNPAILLREIKRSHTSEDLRDIRVRAERLLEKYIYQEVAISFISTIITEINDALIIRTLELAKREMDSEGKNAPDVAYCWMSLGSQGRGEQLLRTDQDNALVFENVPDDQYETVKQYYLDFSVKATRILNEIGYDYCPGNMMASNPEWCMSLDEWKAQFKSWILEPSAQAVMYSSIFFDYRPIYGDRSLTDQLTKQIFDSIEDQTIFLSFLAKNALANPAPLTFFRSFMVEKSGDHKDEFDIKSRAMMPLADAARVLILEAKVSGVNNTFRRFEKLAEMEPQNKELYEAAADAYEILIRYRALQGLKHKNSGRYFKPSNLTKMERINLRNAFGPIRELQALLNLRFQLAFFR